MLEVDVKLLSTQPTGGHLSEVLGRVTQGGEHAVVSRAYE